MSQEEAQPDPLITVTFENRAKLPGEPVAPIIQTSPNTYEVMRVIEDAEREAVATVYRYAGCVCACGQTACAGAG